MSSAPSALVVTRAKLLPALGQRQLRKLGKPAGFANQRANGFARVICRPDGKLETQPLPKFRALAMPLRQMHIPIVVPGNATAGVVERPVRHAAAQRRQRHPRFPTHALAILKCKLLPLRPCHHLPVGHYAARPRAIDVGHDRFSQPADGVRSEVAECMHGLPHKLRQFFWFFDFHDHVIGRFRSPSRARPDLSPHSRNGRGEGLLTADSRFR